MTRIKLDAPIATDTAPASMTSAIEASLSAYPLYLVRLPGASLHQEDDLIWIDSGVPIWFYNGVFRSKLNPNHAQEQIGGIVQHFRRRNLPFVWQLGPSSQPDDLGRQLMASGLVFDEAEPGMALDLQTFGAREITGFPSDLSIERVRNEAMLREWIEVWVFGAPSFIEMTHAVHVQLGYSDNGPCRYYVGYWKGKPVATVMLFLAAGVAAVHHVVTLPEARRRGFGTAMTEFALKEAQQAGFRIAILTASVDGYPIYKRLGFREYGTFAKYRWNP